MNIDHYDWNEIFKCCADILSKSIATDTKPISKISELYNEFKLCYEKDGKDEEIPKEVTFRRKLHSHLKIPNEQRIYKSTLYQLVGIYHKMTIPALASYLTTPYDNTQNYSSYLFYRVKKGNRSILENKQILYSISTELKLHFKNRIIFLSYDDDTIVIMCSSNKSKEFIKKYIEKYIF